ncbi:14500_t:CDS:2, partial [Acaulospora colombiana]
FGEGPDGGQLCGSLEWIGVSESPLAMLVEPQVDLAVTMSCGGVLCDYSLEGFASATLEDNSYELVQHR